MQTSACLPDTMDNMASYPDWLDSCLSVEPKSDDNGVIKDADGDTCSQTAEDSKGTYTRLRSASKPHSTPQTLKWLEENYEIAEGVCIPRSTLYVHYLDYCEKHDTQPVNAASFGKIIRQQFPQLTTRRLGTRGQSKYHYYGIGVRETSEYYEFGFSAKGAQSASDGKKDPSKQIIAYSPRSKLGTLLPDFPDIKDIKLPPEVEEEKVLTFLMMYRTHCQRILDTVIRANFDEVQSFLLHFWQGMPTHIKMILESQVLVTLVGVCDSILYKAIANVLMPTVLQPLPDSLTQVIRHFSMQLDEWLRRALNSLPTCLQRVKFDLARSFAQVLKRQTSLNHLCQAARTVVNSADITAQMLDDWFNIDLNSIIKQTLYTADRNTDQDSVNIVKLARDFEILLEDQAPMGSYVEWLDGMVEQCVVQKSTHTSKGLKTTARHFLLMWSCIGTRIIRDMTLHSAPSFGSFHLLHLMFDEYVMYVVENLHNQEKAAELLRAVKGEVNSHFVEALLTSVTPNEECDGPQRASRLNPGLERGSVIKGPCAEMTLHEQLTGSSNTNYFGPAESDYMSQTSYKANGFPISSNCPSNSPVMSPAYSPRSNIATIPCPTGNGGMKPGYMTCTEHIPNAYNNNDWPPSSFPGMPGEKIDYEHVPCYKISGGFMDNVPSSHTQVQCYDPGYKRHLPSGHVTNGGYTEAVDIGRSGMPEVYPYHVTNLT